MSPTVKKVLYIEDSPVNAALIEEYANHIDQVEVIIATTGEEGVKVAEKLHPDLILMDINLPGITGVQAMEDIKELGGKLSKIPFIALSADAICDEINSALDAGFDDYLTKPVFFDKLKDVLVQYLEL
ncbi:MAG: response regulator [Magnetovibrio sp.]|nr:response regulator [Magnetovibrio sp.]